MEPSHSAQILLGTSGYDYPEWRGAFYPQEMRREDFLMYYAEFFNALELNFSFYSMPSKERLVSFWERSGGRLLFSVKANRLLTHEAGAAWKEAASEFRSAVASLAEKDALSAVLFQFPQGFCYTRENRFYLSHLLLEFADFPVVVEFRHREWVRKSVFTGLSERGASLAFCDMPRLSSLPEYSPFVGGIAYVRLHGRNANAWYASSDAFVSDRNARYRYDYSAEELSSFVPVVMDAAVSGRRVQVFFNNHPEGHGVRNALSFKAMLGEGAR